MQQVSRAVKTTDQRPARRLLSTSSGNTKLVCLSAHCTVVYYLCVCVCVWIFVWGTPPCPSNIPGRNTHPFNGPFSETTQVSRYQKGKPICILLKQETVSGSGLRWAICKSALHSRQITTPAPHHSVYYRPDALPATQPTASKHWRQTYQAKTSK